MIAYEDPEEQKQMLDVSIPILVFILCLCIQIGYTTILQSMYQDERIFPFKQKCTAIQIITLVSKLFTIGAPFANEVEKPIPIVIILSLSLLSILICLFI